MELKLPPPVVFVITLALMYLLSRWIDWPVWLFAGNGYVASILLFVGVSIGVGATIGIKKQRTTIEPRTPEKTTTLVVTGWFNYSRNPMYVSLVIELVAMVVWLGNPINYALVMAFVAYIQRFQIIPEERILVELFGQQYRDYCARVRRWV